MNNAAHAQKDIDYHKVIAREYDDVVVAPRLLTNNVAFGRFASLIKKGDRMLDLGCGTGHMLLRFGDRFSEVIAVDHSAEMLERAKAKVSDTLRGKVKFLQGAALEFLKACQNQSFDLVCCTGFLHHLLPEDIKTVMHEVRRVLKPEGVAIFQEPIEISQSAVPEAVNKWNSDSIATKLSYSVHVEQPDEKPLDLPFWQNVIKNAGMKIVRQNRNWEIFPKSIPPTYMDKISIRYLNLRYGRAGNVLTLAVRPS